MFTGPNIVRDGLVLALDAANTKSFRGEPSTNYATVDLGNWTVEGSASRIATNLTFRGQPVYKARSQVGAVYVAINETISGLRTAAGASGTVTFSIFVRNPNNSAYTVSAYIGHDFSSDRSISANSDWQRIQWTVNQSSMNNDYVEFRPYTNNADIYLEFTMPQVEVNVGTATRFTTGTRGTTVAAGGGWADVSGNDNHGTINNGASTSNDETTRGALTFDGTNDHISKTRVQYGITDPWTVELIFKPTSQVSYWNGLFGGSLTQGGYWMFHSDQLTNYEGYSGDAGTRIKYTGWSYSNTFTVNQFHYLTITYSSIDSSSGTFNLYYNGTEKTQSYDRTFYWSHSLDSRYIGGIAPEGRYGAFAIPLYREYSRTLTQNEVLQNYNSLKTRFGL